MNLTAADLNQPLIYREPGRAYGVWLKALNPTGDEALIKFHPALKRNNCWVDPTHLHRTLAD